MRLLAILSRGAGEFRRDELNASNEAMAVQFSSTRFLSLLRQLASVRFDTQIAIE